MFGERITSHLHAEVLGTNVKSVTCIVFFVVYDDLVTVTMCTFLVRMLLEYRVDISCPLFHLYAQPGKVELGTYVFGSNSFSCYRWALLL